MKTLFFNPTYIKLDLYQLKTLFRVRDIQINIKIIKITNRYYKDKETLEIREAPIAG